VGIIGMSIPDATRKMLAKMIGMLGSDSDGECLNAARLLKARMKREGVSFGDLSNLIQNGAAGEPRTIIVEKRAEPNPAGDIADAILDRAGQRLTYAERVFLNDIVRSVEMTGGHFELTSKQANWLSLLKAQYLKPKTPTHRAPKPKKDSTYRSMASDLGLDD
jgi:hypothetical protein